MGDVQEKHETPTQVERATAEIDRFLEGKAIGSPELMAANDHADHENLQRQTQDQLERIWKQKGPVTESSLSALRMLEQRQALAADRISDRQATVQGYASALFKVRELMSELDGANIEEGRRISSVYEFRIHVNRAIARAENLPSVSA